MIPNKALSLARSRVALYQILAGTMTIRVRECVNICSPANSRSVNVAGVGLHRVHQAVFLVTPRAQKCQTAHQENAKKSHKNEKNAHKKIDHESHKKCKKMHTDADVVVCVRV